MELKVLVNNGWVVLAVNKGLIVVHEVAVAGVIENRLSNNVAAADYQNFAVSGDASV